MPIPPRSYAMQLFLAKHSYSNVSIARFRDLPFITTYLGDSAGSSSSRQAAP
jgi:hypothetical protein